MIKNYEKLSGEPNKLPEEKARVKIDRQLLDAGWEVVSRFNYNRNNPSAVKEALMKGRKESDYLLFVDNRVIAVIEAKRDDVDLRESATTQAEDYTVRSQEWYGFWLDKNRVPLVYLANGNEILFKNMFLPDSDYEKISKMHTPKEMMRLIGKKSEWGMLPRINSDGLRDCQYRAAVNLEANFKMGKKKGLAVLATGAGKTYLACLEAYRLLNYTPVSRVLFLADRNNLARQAETEFKLFDRTENRRPLNDLYTVTRLKRTDDIYSTVVISTIQKLYSVLTGQAMESDDEDKEDECRQVANDKQSKEIITLGDYLKLPPDFFQFIVIDECHRSIYGRWKAVLEYFGGAKILGLTATPTEEAYAFFNKTVVENYTYDDSVVDGVNVPKRTYRIKTDVTEHGGTIKDGDTIKETAKLDGSASEQIATERIDYTPTELDRSVVNTKQIETVLREFANIIYTELYPERVSESGERDWAHIPKTLIFAKDDEHATRIVETARKVFSEKFLSGQAPENFVKKITYSAEDSNALIRDFRTEKDFRIAVTVTLVATGTDIKPLEIVLFMNDVKSAVLYTQMKGRACRTIDDEKFKEITPNADGKYCYYIVDAVGVTESEKTQPSSSVKGTSQRPLSLEHLIERLAHGEVTDDNLALLRDYCSTIHKRYENNALFGRHLAAFIDRFDFSPRELANTINTAIQNCSLPAFTSVSDENPVRMQLIDCLIDNIDARRYLLEMQRGYYAEIFDDPDEVIYSGFSKETARSFTDDFERYLDEHKDRIEALRIIYNSEDTVITYAMLRDLSDKLLAENREYTPHIIWNHYKLLDSDGSVEKFDTKNNVKALTHLIQIVRFAYKKIPVLTSLFTGYKQRFNLYCGQVQRELTAEQGAVMRQISDYIVSQGALTMTELDVYFHEDWRRGVLAFGKEEFKKEMETLSKFILKAA